MSKKNKKPIKVKESKYIYISTCCNKPATKPPVERSSADFKENKYSECGLGHWTCSQCMRGCSVRRTKPTEPNGPTGTEEGTN